MTKTTCNRLYEFWDSSISDQRTNLRLYKCAVWSKLTHGNVAWKLTEKTLQFLNGFNFRCLARITGRGEEEEEARISTDECNPVTFVRKLRFQWVGHILRRDETFTARRMLMGAQKTYDEESILMYAPEHNTMAVCQSSQSSSKTENHGKQSVVQVRYK